MFLWRIFSSAMKILKKLIIIVALVICYVFSNAVSIYIYSFKDDARNADVAIVLGASTYNGHPSPVYQERINHAVDLYKKHLVKKIITTGGYGKGNPVSDAYNAKLYAVSQGVPEDDVLTEDQSTVTLENLINAKKIMDVYNYQTALIVSDPLHMKRAMLMAKDHNIECYSSPTPTTRYVSLKSTLPFLLREIFFYAGYQIYAVFFFFLSLFTSSSLKR